jgi:hypothetical protein
MRFSLWNAYPKQQALILKHGRCQDIMGHTNEGKIINIKETYLFIYIKTKFTHRKTKDRGNSLFDIVMMYNIMHAPFST